MLVLLANLVLSAMLTGLIWTIQIVHYPLFAHVGGSEFARYVAVHGATITPLVGPLMLAELAAALLLVAVALPPGVPSWLPWVAGALLAVVWLTTAFASVPSHARLSDGWDATAHQWLVASNWLRTVGWSARTALLAWALWVALPPSLR